MRPTVGAVEEHLVLTVIALGAETATKPTVVAIGEPGSAASDPPRIPRRDEADGSRRRSAPDRRGVLEVLARAAMRPDGGYRRRGDEMAEWTARRARPRRPTAVAVGELGMATKPVVTVGEPTQT